MLNLPRLQDVDVMPYIREGNAVVIIQDEMAKYTIRYKASKSKDGKVVFIGYRSGPGYKFKYLCYINKDGWIQLSEKSPLPANSSIVRMFEEYMENYPNLPMWMKDYYSNKCGYCGRPLKDPKSQIRGFGPECSKHIYIF